MTDLSLQDQSIKNQTSPLVSVIMPTYNAERYIAEAIESVLNQTYSNWELIIIDDNSQDKTQEVVQRYPDSRIYYRKMPRIGHPAGVRNVGLKMSQGDFIAFLDSDDIYFPDALSILITPLLKNARYKAAFGFLKRVDQCGNLLMEPYKLIPNPDGTYNLPPYYQQNWETMVLGQSTFTPCALMLRRTTLERVGYFNEALLGAEDFEFYMRLYLDDFEGVLCIPNYIYKYRRVPSSLTTDLNRFRNVSDATLSILKWLFAHPKLPEHVKAYKSKAYTFRYLHLAREFLMAGHPQMCRQIVVEAYHEPNINFGDWFRRCLQLYIRAFIPHSLDKTLIRLKKNIRDSQAIKRERQLQHI